MGIRPPFRGLAFAAIVALAPTVADAQTSLFPPPGGGQPTVPDRDALRPDTTPRLPESRLGAGQPALPGSRAAAANEVLRLEEELRRLTGRLEEVEHAQARLSERVDRLAEDLEFRLNALEQAVATLGPETSGDTATAARELEEETPAGEPSASPAPAPREAAADLGAGRDATATPGAAAATAGNLPAGPPAEQYERAFGLLREGNYEAAQEALEAFLAAHPDDPLAGNASYWLGETYYVRGNHEQAAATFARNIQEYPQSNKAPDNLLKLGMSLGALGRENDACRAYDELSKRFPQAPAHVQQAAERERSRYRCG